MYDPLRALVIDDNPDDRLLTTRQLKEEFPNIDVIPVLGPEQLREEIERGGFNFAITDFDLKWSDGIRVARLIKSNHPYCSVIMFTGTGTEEIAVEAMKAGIDDYVIKRPSQYVRLGAAVRAASARTDALRKVAQLAAERERLLETERNAREESERANKVRNDFMATLAHELRTPLTAILGWTKILLASSVQPEMLQRGLSVIARNVALEARLIDDLSDASKLSRDELRLDLEDLDIVHLVEICVNSIRSSANAKGVQVRTVFEAGLSGVKGDRLRIEQIVRNVLDNGVKFSKPGGIVVVKAERSGRMVVVSVIDEGIGIASELLSQVFDEFRQADGSTSRKHRGLGMGLAFVRKLVRLHGGRVSIQSEGPGKGSTCTIELPASDVRGSVA